MTLTCFQTYAGNILPQDGPGITLMVLRGEVSPLEKLSNSDGLAKLPAKAGLFRAESNFDASNKAIEEFLKDRKVLAQKGAGAEVSPRFSAHDHLVVDVFGQCA
ncbi:hypothetical protein [Xanthomonas populi]|uniref:hypothetical protein n=1 Tax=Xanthomonas populi TaxID=53414 RepID=UPI000FF89259|nr:hypothetical protein [Xanthomonas populi]